ncbi:MAG: alanine racemase, partial [archaeon]
MLKERIVEIHKEINSQANLVVAVKYANEEQIKEIIDSGVDIGFNTFQQFEEVSGKNDLSKIKVHFIGRIQTNKIGKIVRFKPYLIQSVSSFEIANRINSVCSELNVKQRILLQLNTDSEKIEGFDIDDFENEIIKMRNLGNIEICGLMTIPPEKEKIGEEKLREIYKKMKSEYDRIPANLGLNFKFLSMGMSEDYLIAIAEGANIVRVGRKIFQNEHI